MTKLLIDGLAFAEGPRWHEDRLWISDMHSQQVLAIDLDGNAETICRVEQDPSGLGWLPDGTLLVVSMRDRRLLRLVAGKDDEAAHIVPFHNRAHKGATEGAGSAGDEDRASVNFHREN